MTTPEDGKEYVDVREIWRDEALDFTPWLARNLDLLSEAIGIQLELVQEEAPVGPFSCDILARDKDSGVNVAIENQLEWSDHSHFGQMLTYTAGHNAGVGVWVAPYFSYEHAEALNWLNQWTREGLSFYGVKVELVKAGDSSYEPKLQCVVFPGGWNKEITQPPGATISPFSQQFQEFFRPLIDQVLWEGFADKATQHFGSGGRFFPSRLSEASIGYAVSFEGENAAWVTLHIRTEDRELTNRIFDELITDRENIESSIIPLGQEWYWNRFDREAFSSVNIRRDGSIYDPAEKLEETRAWMLDMLPKFKEVFDPRLEKILLDLSA